MNKLTGAFPVETILHFTSCHRRSYFECKKKIACAKFTIQKILRMNPSKKYVSAEQKLVFTGDSVTVTLTSSNISVSNIPLIVSPDKTLQNFTIDTGLSTKLSSSCSGELVRTGTSKTDSDTPTMALHCCCCFLEEPWQEQGPITCCIIYANIMDTGNKQL